MDFNWGSEFDHLCTPSLEEDELASLDAKMRAESTRKRTRVVAAFFALTGHYLRYPGCVGKYSTADTTQEFRYQRSNFVPWARGMGDAVFRRFYRMPFGAFQRLVALLRPSMEKNHVSHGRWNSEAQAARSSGRNVTRITVEMKVAMGLRWLAGGAYQDIAVFHGVSITSFWRAKDDFMDAIHECKELDITFPALDDDAALRELADGFKSLSMKELFSYCIGAIDGILIQLASVMERDSSQPIKFYTRKGSYALNVQAIADSRRRFRYFCVNCPGSTHDSVAWMYTPLFMELEKRGIIGKYFFVADAAYRDNIAVCTPFTQSAKLSQQQQDFNFFLSQVRIEVECAFGIFGIFWRGLRASLGNATRIIEACMKLHNYCIDHGDDCPDPDVEVPEYEGYPCEHGPGCTHRRCRGLAVRSSNEDRPYANRNGGPAADMSYDPPGFQQGLAMSGVMSDLESSADRVPRSDRVRCGGPRQRNRTHKIRQEILEAVVALNMKWPPLRRFTRRTAKVLGRAV
eukprot:1458044-Rhodomonas_salina.1